ncbi:hypothetical protein H310_02329 [Aphanomyces invadans]|uniref:Uncharacterized protein n=1 Tax=Aphanomyces invadans TaxID=157072 RepID=A0A024UP45_9STRA|nr:hypothetical protein H310_02329 [Aphanomyces invadans]ETW07925.1 hypothetical protein H310_02329 [Aphanomyces invadans]|eukprot:XP_008864018.1 hypothetical protein H310_02329 [Aphanomyces invadans]
MGERKMQSRLPTVVRCFSRQDVACMRLGMRRRCVGLPFDCCAITLTPFKNPVCTRQGHLFDIEAVIPYVKEHGINPVTGETLTVKDLIRLHFHKNPEGEYACPITYRVFTNSTKIAAVATSGNVYAFDALEELNIKSKNWHDLMTGEEFKRKDIIILQDPADLGNREIDSFEHFRRAKENEKTKQDVGKQEHQTIRVSSATARIFQEMEAAKALKRKREEELKQDKTKQTEEERIAASVSHASADTTPTPGKNGKLQYSKFTDGKMSQSFTSTMMDPSTRSQAALATEAEVLETRWANVKKLKKKGYVRLVTNFGAINLELDCDFVPRTCDNFLGLCAKGYYNGVIFHRIIRGFMMQGGDPSGTGQGGESIWGAPFKDEFDSRLLHSKRGVLSMANSGSNTNNSQFFITFKACHYLDNKHSVFGRVVGGMEVLDEIEALSTDKNDRPYDKVQIQNVVVFENPFAQYEEAENQGLTVEDVKRKEEAPVVQGTVIKVGDDWIAYDGMVDMPVVPVQAASANSGVGKYLKIPPAAPTKKKSAAAIGDDDPPIAKKGKAAPVTSSFSNFDNW